METDGKGLLDRLIGGTQTEVDAQPPTIFQIFQESPNHQSDPAKAKVLLLALQLALHTWHEPHSAL